MIRGLICWMLLAVGPLAAQTFEVATVKVSPFTGSGFLGIRTEGARFTAQHESLVGLVSYAYDVEEFLISGGPAWASSHDLYGTDRYDVVGVAEGNPPLAQFRSMLQALLKERFQLSAHRATKNVPAYALVQNEGGAKLKPSVLGEGQSPSTWTSGRQESKYEAKAVTMEALTFVLRTAAGRPVVDRTGLKGAYAFTLQYAAGTAPDAAVTAPSIFTAVREQLGLKLESVVVPFDGLVIDKVERPSEN